MKKMDIILIAVVILLAAGLYFSGILRPGAKGGEAVAIVDGKEIASYSLDDEGVFEINQNGHINILEIHDGCADVTDASCPDKLCVKQASIQYTGQTIVCLPNKLVIEIKGAAESTVDMTTGKAGGGGFGL